MLLFIMEIKLNLNSQEARLLLRLLCDDIGRNYYNISHCHHSMYNFYNNLLIPREKLRDKLKKQFNL